jgi:hypothetical protein
MGKAGDPSPLTGLRAGKAHREALALSRTNPFGVVELRDEDGNTEPYFGGSKDVIPR